MPSEQPSFLSRLLGSRREEAADAEPRSIDETEGAFALPSPIVAGFDLASLQCASEARLLQKLAEKPDFNARLAELSTGRDQALVQQHVGLIAGCYRADRSITPELSELVDILGQTLRLQVPVDLFVRADPTLNAFCVPSRNGKRLVMAINSALVESLPGPGLLSVMGHEAGHALLGHGQHPRVEFGHPRFSFLEVARLRALERRREVACDRVGLLASQDVRVTCNALLRVLSGLSDKWFVFDEAAYCEHFERIQGEMGTLGAEGGIETHPIIPLRIAALIAFARSELYAKALGAGTWEIDADELGRQAETMLASLEPDFTALEGVKEEEAVNYLLVWGALLVIAADGVVDPAELGWLRERMTGLTIRPEEVGKLAQPQERERVLKELAGAAQVVCMKLNGFERVGLLRVMCEVAQSASGIPKPEFEVLDRLRQLLDVPSQVAQGTLDSVRAERLKTVSARTETKSSSPKVESAKGDTAKSGDRPPSAGSDTVTSQSSPDLAAAAADQNVTVPEVIHLIVTSEMLRDEAKKALATECEKIIGEERSIETAVRRIVAWAIAAARSAGPLSLAQSRQVVLAVIDVLRDVKQALGVRLRVPATPTSIQLKRYGLVALFRRGEKVKRASDGAVLVVESVSRVRGEVLVRAETETPDQAVGVRPQQLLKSVTDDVWPPELSMPI